MKLRDLARTAGLALAVTGLLTGTAAVVRTGAADGRALAPEAPSGAAAGRTPAGDAFHPVVREAAEGLPDRTVYRPADGKAVRQPLPVLIWQNGGCRPANMLFMNTLMLVAARGFVVVADGAPDAPSDTATGSPQPERVTQVIDWLKHDRLARKQLGNKINVSAIAVAGQSCGGVEALVAGADRRVDSVLSLNSGFFPTPFGGYGRENLADLHTPVLFVDGGPFDAAHANAVANYDLVTVPAAHVTNPQAGHALAFYGMRLDDAGRPLPDDGRVTLLEEQVEVIVNWLDYTLNGNRKARAYFTGSCGLCGVPGWSVQTKNGL
ncbi:hypothetical protein AB0H57_17645 [Micromonospora sp. NPDC050686]|uniref:hypothetical protein n=1 Tax=Micromonospora sp. NPDC050686 TaxID=3154631 RepID=UPI0033F96131